jgi:hypothetical protein
MEKITTSRMPWFFAGLLALFAVALLSHRHATPVPPPPPGKGEPAQQPAQQIDLVIAIDTSSSMDGLIDAARQQLWETVGQLGRAEPRPRLRVGLISYGNTSYDAAAGWVRLDGDLSTDLDSVYARLFALRTGGGEEYVARALYVAATRMTWSQEPGTRRMFIVAGNEPADQDREISLQRALGEAQERGITVNTIYCGSESNGEVALWRSLAQDGGGKFAAIDHNAAVTVATPVDSELARLSAALNSTYVAYGSGGATRAQNQAAQDQNAATIGAPAAAARAVAKSSGLYRNDEWDLVDALKDGKLAQVKDEELPADLRKMSSAERQAFLTKKAEERAALQQRISELSVQRAGHVQAAKAKMKPGRRDLGDAMKSMF